MRRIPPRILLILAALATALQTRAAVQLEISDDSLRLSGTVSSMAQRECLRSLLREASSKLLLDHLEIDRRQMVRWMPVMMELLGSAAQALTSGRLRLEGDSITVSGAVRSAEEQTGLLRQLDALRQPGLAVEVALSVRAPEPEPWIEATFSESELALTGLVALPETGTRLQADFPSSTVVQNSGGAPFASWEAELLPALPALLTGIRAEVADGAIRFSPGRAAIQGTVADLGPKLRVTRLIKSALGSGLLVENFLSVDSPPLPAAEIAVPPAEPEPEAKSEVVAEMPSPETAPPNPSPAPVASPSADPSPPPAVASQAPQEGVRTLVFNPASTWITPASLSVIESTLAEFKALPASARMVIRSHVDRDGDPEVNQSLSQKRAAGVRQALVKGGIAGSRIEIEIPLLPAAPSPSERRVELILRR